MKKSININLGGRLFQIDEDAFDILRNYLNSIKDTLGKSDDENEIVEDIETRISELLDEIVGDGKARIITFANVQQVINKVGGPEVIGSSGEENEKNKAYENVNEKQAQESAEAFGNHYIKQPRKLFRDSKDRLLGGVLSGLATFFGVNATLIRLIVALIVILSGFWWFVIVYCVLWLVIPKAKTITDVLMMNGIQPTPEAISEKLKEESLHAQLYYCRGDNSVIVHILKIIAIVIAVIIISPMMFILGGLLILLIMVSVLGFSLLSLPIFATIPIEFPTTFLWCAVLLFAIPFFSIFHWIMKKVANWRPLNIWIKLLLIFSWFTIIGMGIWWVVDKIVNITDIKIDPGVSMKSFANSFANFSQSMFPNTSSVITTGSGYFNGVDSKEGSECVLALWRDIDKIPFVVEASKIDNRVSLIFMERGDFENKSSSSIDVRAKFAENSQNPMLKCYWDDASKTMYVDYSSTDGNLETVDCINDMSCEQFNISHLDSLNIDTDNMIEIEIEFKESNPSLFVNYPKNVGVRKRDYYAPDEFYSRKGVVW